MRNNKGFTLMELIAAIFIGGMVTAALILIWKTASVQTSQGQRQTIMRNQISNFQRQLYRDFYSADIITFPSATASADPDAPNGNTMILNGFKKAKQINASQFESFTHASPKGFTKEFCYCYNKTDHWIRRYEYSLNTNTNTHNINNFSDFGADCLDACINGEIVLTDFTLTSGTLTDGYNYNLKGAVRRVFSQQSGTTPIYIEIDETLLKQGGV